MKKHIIAAAVAAAVTAPAMAQNVTIYGLVDMAYQTNEWKNSKGTSNVSQKATYFGQGAIAGSRIGFRGEEDLGGGSKAGFLLEQGIDPSVGAGFNTRASGDGIPLNGGATSSTSLPVGSNAGGETWNNSRQAFVFMSNSNLGTLRLGRVYGLGYDMVTFNGYIISENVGNRQAGIWGTALPRIRGSQYLSPTIAGSVNLALAYGGADSDAVNLTSEGANNTGAGYISKKSQYQAGRVMWNQGPAKLGYSYEQITSGCLPNSTAITPSSTTGIVTEPTPYSYVLNGVGGTYSTCTTTATTGDLKTRLNTLAGAYNFGMVELMGIVNRIKADPASTSTQTKIQLNQISARVPVGGSASIGVNYADRVAKNTNDKEISKVRAAFFLAKYDMSKRTSVYAFTGNEKENSDGNLGPSLANTLGQKITRSGLGLFHAF